MTSILPEARFGVIEAKDDGRIESFIEKPVRDEGRVNGGYFVCNPEIFSYLNDREDLILEQGPLAQLAADEQVHAFNHDGYWACMDTQRDKEKLIDLWNSNRAPWKIWKN